MMRHPISTFQTSSHRRTGAAALHLMSRTDNSRGISLTGCSKIHFPPLRRSPQALPGFHFNKMISWRSAGVSGKSLIVMIDVAMYVKCHERMPGAAEKWRGKKSASPLANRASQGGSLLIQACLNIATYIHAMVGSEGKRSVTVASLHVPAIIILPTVHYHAGCFATMRAYEYTRCPMAVMPRYVGLLHRRCISCPCVSCCHAAKLALFLFDKSPSVILRVICLSCAQPAFWKYFLPRSANQIAEVASNCFPPSTWKRYAANGKREVAKIQTHLS